MRFPERIKQLREDQKLLQRHLAAQLDMDTAMYSRIERGERFAKKEQVQLLARILGADESELLRLWLADKVYNVIYDEEEPEKVLNIVAENLTHYGR